MLVSSTRILMRVALYAERVLRRAQHTHVHVRFGTWRNAVLCAMRVSVGAKLASEYVDNAFAHGMLVELC